MQLYITNMVVLYGVWNIRQTKEILWWLGSNKIRFKCSCRCCNSWWWKYIFLKHMEAVKPPPFTPELTLHGKKVAHHHTVLPDCILQYELGNAHTWDLIFSPSVINILNTRALFITKFTVWINCLKTSFKVLLLFCCHQTIE